MTEFRDLVALSFLPPWQWREIGGALRAGEPPSDVLVDAVARVRHDPPTPAELRARADDAIDRAARGPLRPLAWTEPAYPAALAAIVDPPWLLWLRGSPDALDRPAVAIVGSRAGSPYALAVAERLAEDLAARGVAVVSGLARGVDSAAHRGALASPGGVTIGVLGSGADVIYPPEHDGLVGEIEASGGAILSELAPGTPPLPWCFPLRNRIISGLSRAVVVIEAGERSGSLITARTALEQGRDVLAVPGNVLSGRNRGAHALLRDGAKIVESADDIWEELGLPGPAARAAGTEIGSGTVQGGEGTDPVLACLPPGETCDLDLICERSGLSAARLLPRLFELELDGRVRRAGGGRFVRV